MAKNMDINSTYMIMFRDFPDVVGITELCQILGIGRNKAYNLIKEKKIKAIPCSRKIKVPKIAVIDYLLQNI